MAKGALIFISGGVRSGKSAYAEQIVLASGAARRIYLASGRAEDAEMKARILRHQQDRSGHSWKTIDQPVNMAAAVGEIQSGDAILWDCATTWLANELYEGWEQNNPCIARHGCMEQKWLDLQGTLAAMLQQAHLLVVVSNEVLDDFVRDEAYQKWLGTIHRWLAAEAGQAIEMENGIAYRRK
ncbi:bifunctional adenosylcobinamide kinase/adenosylcobinamide-phosphate guanylyltransferase [Planococcus sp. YIM B11945]|uniref:bifunctional adenosylcobinamide kinase/adenosylcobinamide-phosphate guanylyltransferase n=1 Tax=Planococcus sp. YIM B11945 TaxID=3435410 RepID=UPI003D7C9BFF